MPSGSAKPAQQARQHVEAGPGVRPARAECASSAKKCEAAYTSDTSTMAQHRARLARDRRVHDAAHDGFLEQRDEQSRCQRRDDERAQSPASNATPGFSARMSSATIVSSTGSMSSGAEYEGDFASFTREIRAPAGHKPRLRAIRDLQPPRDEQEAHEERQHRDAAGDAVELEFRSRATRELPGGIREQRDASERQRDQAEEDRETAHAAQCLARARRRARRTGLWPARLSSASRPSRPTKCSVPTTTR